MATFIKNDCLENEQALTRTCSCLMMFDSVICGSRALFRMYEGRRLRLQPPNSLRIVLRPALHGYMLRRQTRSGYSLSLDRGFSSLPDEVRYTPHHIIKFAISMTSPNWRHVKSPFLVETLGFNVSYTIGSGGDKTYYMTTQLFVAVPVNPNHVAEQVGL